MRARVRSRAEGTRLKFGGQQRGGIITPAFASQITGSDVLEVFEAEIDRRSAIQADAIGFAILGEWEGRVMTLWMIAAEDEIDELLEHALGSLLSVVGQSPAEVKQALYQIRISKPARIVAMITPKTQPTT